VVPKLLLDSREADCREWLGTGAGLFAFLHHIRNVIRFSATFDLRIFAEPAAGSESDRLDEGARKDGRSEEEAGG
jgi:hypothetical protein